MPLKCETEIKLIATSVYFSSIVFQIMVLEIYSARPYTASAFLVTLAF